ncbi:DUF3667 domain-containing protein [Cytophagaceae bacterium 50C-KIRBA]|uniref:DUF3667 domain-containing protein n=1 Tax=Aquirufa beregesia TaxID=2516556 RepID=A0ABX0F128_9BACT|nr:DUF3667 domain-containing protein [Aquirufa beregesia]
MKDYINGKQASHFKPFSFVIIIATVYRLLSKNLFFNSGDSQSLDSVLRMYVSMIEWTLKHLTYTTIALIVTTSIASYWAFQKQGFILLSIWF